MPSAGGGPGGPQYIIQLFVRGRIFDKHRDYGTQGLSYTFSTPAGARLGVFDISPRFMCPVTGAVEARGGRVKVNAEHGVCERYWRNPKIRKYIHVCEKRRVAEAPCLETEHRQ